MSSGVPKTISIKLCLIFLSLFILLGLTAVHADNEHKTPSHFKSSPSIPDVVIKEHQKVHHTGTPKGWKTHRRNARPEEYLTSYEADYGNPVTSNFSSLIYDNDDNPSLFPNPDLIYDGKGSKTDQAEVLPDVDLPDNSLADADLNDHNIIDSVTYLYGINRTTLIRSQWLMMIYATRFTAGLVSGGATLWLLMSESSKPFRKKSKLYPIIMNLLCCLTASNMIYMEAILGASSSSRCEILALLLHYAHLVCAAWLLLICASITDYCLRNAVPSLKYYYLYAYGIPATMVFFNFGLAVEHYETKHYCWMSLEKGMLIGFMVPGTVLIIATTIMVLFALNNIGMKQNELLATKIQEIINDEIHVTAPNGGDMKNDSTETLDNLDDVPQNEIMHDDCRRSSVTIPITDSNCDLGPRLRDHNEMTDDALKLQSIKMGIMDMSLDNLSWKSASFAEGNELKRYLYFSLIIQPFFDITWVMGVVALENSGHWLSPTIFLILCLAMYIYISVHVATVQPIIQATSDELASCCEDVVSEATCITQRTTDSIPLLDSACVQQPMSSTAPGDTISTISI